MKSSRGTVRFSLTKELPTQGCVLSAFFIAPVISTKWEYALRGRKSSLGIALNRHLNSQFITQFQKKRIWNRFGEKEGDFFLGFDLYCDAEAPPNIQLTDKPSRHSIASIFIASNAFVYTVRGNKMDIRY